MKKHWTEGASAIVREQIKALLREPYRCTDGGLSRAESWYQAAQLAWRNGVDIDPPPHAATDRVLTLRAAKDFEALNHEYRETGLSFEHDREVRYLVRYQAMRRWASEPDELERREAALAAATKAQQEAEIEARALAIVAEQNRAALEKARQQARKELGQ